MPRDFGQSEDGARTRNHTRCNMIDYERDRTGGLRVFAQQLGDLEAGFVDVLEHGRGPVARGTVYAIEQTVLAPVDILRRVL